MKRLLFLFAFMPLILEAQGYLSVEAGANNHHSATVGASGGYTYKGILADVGMVTHASTSVYSPTIFTAKIGYEVWMKEDVWSVSGQMGMGWQFASDDKRELNVHKPLYDLSLLYHPPNWPIQWGLSGKLTGQFQFYTLLLKTYF